jgi:hypothetical protein
LKERFFSKIAGTNDKGCHLWKGSKNKNGYGYIGRGGKYGKRVLASRLAYEYAYGEFDQSLDVLHTCDNPGCVNPAHLFLGTHQDNMADMVTKRRHAHGSRTCGAKLTDEKVLEIRAKHAGGNVSYDDLAIMYGVGVTCICMVIKRRTWKHI